MPFQSPPFWWVDDNTRIRQWGGKNVDGAPPRHMHYFDFAFGMQNACELGVAPPRFYTPSNNTRRWSNGLVNINTLHLNNNK